MNVKEIQEIQQQLQKMNKSQIEEVYHKTLSKHSKGSKKEMIKNLLRPLEMNYKITENSPTKITNIPVDIWSGFFNAHELRQLSLLNRRLRTQELKLRDMANRTKFIATDQNIHEAVQYYLKNNLNKMGQSIWEYKYGYISEWDVSNVTDMSNLFRNAKKFDGNISKWDVSNVRDMEGMFWCAKNFNQDINTKVVTREDGTKYTAWDVSNVTNMKRMFAYATKFNGDISNWNISNVRNMNYMFFNAKNFNGDISNWNISNVRNMNYMFFNAKNFNQDINTKDVIREDGTKYEAWNYSRRATAMYIFEGAKSLVLPDWWKLL
jgi:surface protein